MKFVIRPNLDLIGCVALCAVVLAMQVVPVPPLQLVSGLLMVLFVPGYACVVALFNEAAGLDRPARLALSLGLSVTMLPLISLVLNVLPWGLRPWPVTLSLVIVTLAFVLLALVRRWRRPLLPPEPVGPARRPLFWRVGGAVVVLVGLALGLGTTLFVLRQPDATSQSTEFYALGGDGLAENYPREVRQNEPFQLTLAVTNRTASSERYQIRASGSQGALATLGPIDVTPAAAWTQPMTLTLTTAGANQKIEIELFRQPAADPYRRLVLWVNVRPGS